MKEYYGINLSEKWAALLDSEAAKPLVNDVISNANRAIQEEIPALKMSEYMLYYETGDRSIFEKDYFHRRNQCASLMMALWLTGEEKYVKPLVDYISYICDEFTWCLPAHINYPQRTYQEALEHIDLFQAETARLFAEIVMCVGEKLPKYIQDRMEHEIRRRIFASLQGTGGIVKGQAYWWETCKMNWATVCGAGCLMAALVFGAEADKEGFVNRFIGCLDSYLEGVEEDGCCQEGTGYWHYGFGNFVRLAEMVRVYTGGRIDYFTLPKVKELALFLQRVRISNDKAVAFSDNSEQFEFNPGLLSFLKSIYPEVVLPDLKCRHWDGKVRSITDLLWFDENYEKEAKRAATVDYFDSTQWYINRKENYSFASKGGNNGEPHNHNDIGAFAIIKGEETMISDLGAGVYTKETFQPDTRYTLLQNSSRGHSVPIINGEYQCDGSQFCANNVKATDHTFQLDIEGAYTDGLVEKINRCFELYDDKILLRDRIVPSVQTRTVTERFVSRLKPELLDGCVDFGVGKILYDSGKYDAKLSVEEYQPREEKEKATVYLIDIVSKDKMQMEFELEFVL